MNTRVAVVGAGSWGTALASLLSGKGYDVILWSRGKEIAASINDHNENRAYLPGVALPRTLRASVDLHEALDDAELVVAVVPSHAMRDTMNRAARVMRSDALVVSASKGIEDDTLLTMHGVIADAVGDEHRVTALSGPSFAVEVAGGQPAVVVAAATSEQTAERVQHYFHAPMLRVYRSTDMVGVELGGVVKNVMAIATGVSDGLGYGLNARAATITRGLAEIMRLAISMGGRPETLSGLAGIGDLVLTCTGDLSRNRQVGLRLGRGESIDSILGGMRMVAEGVRNTKSVLDLARRQKVEMPIVECAYKVLYEGLPPSQALEELFGRSLKPEFP
ncbi:MAG TPA: NAD(P)H-dependent glycerol-3-phosphate dehydrogenase [Candidatus Limnocylindrales bacterium]|nr:NAD(P)H-dependent glycerol-3-phosphate dehydrogenase [Candidatus Limnocylindrales bacterium]